MTPPTGTAAPRPEVPLALLAHELRNLLAPIRYAIATLEKPDKTAAQESYALGVMRRQSTQMSRVLEDLLDLSRFANGEVELRKCNTELTMVLGSAIEATRPILDRKQHALSVELPKDAVRLWADPTRLVQAFSNLLINAAKYTDNGGRIELCAAQDADSVIISVRDTGIGIAEDMLPHIFTLFAQATAARSRAEGGLGIGLALVQSIVRLHGGTIEVFSAGAYRGTEFRIRIPLGTPRDEQPAVQQNPRALGGTGLRVLVVDDNDDVANTCGTLIELTGHQVVVAYTATEALILAESFRPQVILTDIGLPDIGGYAFAQRIRATPWGQATVLVAITGWSNEDRHQGSSAYDFSHHLTKPIDPETIVSLLQLLAEDLAP